MIWLALNRLTSLVLLLTCTFFLCTIVEAGITTRISVNSVGAEGNGNSPFPRAISSEGRFIAFESRATNLVPGDTNGFIDVFVHDRQTGETSRVSVSSAGEEANAHSSFCLLSMNGRFVAFESRATNLVPGDTNGLADIFVHDRQTGETSRVSVSSAGEEADGFSANPELSADGQLIAFESRATNLVPGDTNGLSDIFVHDRQTGETSRVSVSSAGEEGRPAPIPFGLLGSVNPAISADGRFVAFNSHVRNLVPNDTNAVSDIFVHDRETGETSQVSLSSLGIEGNDDSFIPRLSADGRFVAFGSESSNLVPEDTNGVEDAFVYDRQEGETERVSTSSSGMEANAGSFNYAISADGRFVSFNSNATNLVPGDTNGVTDIFVHDRQTDITERVSINSFGIEGDGASAVSPLSADGRFVAFGSESSNLVVGDSNGVSDVFLHDRYTMGVLVDIKPGSDPNSINLKSNGVIPVAILTTNGFDATTVDPLSVRFGPNSTEETHERGHIEDADGDGADDMVLHFRTQETGIQCGDTEAGLAGITLDGQEIEGSDSITVKCK